MAVPLMPHRQFTDSKGTTWDVWEVEPSHAERRRPGHDRRRTARPGPDRRRSIDDMRVRISSELTQGWLVFQSTNEKRRLTPVPEGWAHLDDAALERLLSQAALSGRPRRLIE
jgi:hypothetical protein